MSLSLFLKSHETLTPREVSEILKRLRLLTGSIAQILGNPEAYETKGIQSIIGSDGDVIMATKVDRESFYALLADSLKQVAKTDNISIGQLLTPGLIRSIRDRLRLSTNNNQAMIGTYESPMDPSEQIYGLLIPGRIVEKVYIGDKIGIKPNEFSKYLGKLRELKFPFEVIVTVKQGLLLLDKEDSRKFLVITDRASDGRQQIRPTLVDLLVVLILETKGENGVLDFNNLADIAERYGVSSESIESSKYGTLKLLRNLGYTVNRGIRNTYTYTKNGI